jgi:Gpi18-like mannosyltransferase
MSKNVNQETTLNNSNLQVNGYLFVILMWLLSRLVIMIAMQVIAPLLYKSPVHPHWQPPYPLDFSPDFIPQPSWELFSHWDGKWYRRIAVTGYDYADDKHQHSIAFYPLFPLIIRGLMMFGLPFEVAGTVVSNLSFLGALLLLYYWAKERHGTNVARWATAVLAWCPFSLYGTVIYTEGLFLFLTTAALRAFDHRQYFWAAICGALASATRAAGITLLPTFIFVAWRERRSLGAYAAGLFVAVGLLLFSLYCAIRFQDPLAFVHAQKAWAQPTWWYIFKDAILVGRDSLIKVVMVFGGGYMLWCVRTQLSNTAVVYGFCSLLLIIFSGALMSVSRYAYGIASLSLGLGLLFSYQNRWGYVILCWFAILLFFNAINFTIWNWVA